MRLEVTRRSDLAIRALLALGAGSDRTKAAELAERVGTTKGFLTQVMNPLVQQGWVRSDPGPTGGYVADFDPAEVSVLAVIEAIEGPVEHRDVRPRGPVLRPGGHAVHCTARGPAHAPTCSQTSAHSASPR